MQVRSISHKYNHGLLLYVMPMVKAENLASFTKVANANG